jgi:hypothetical protein
MATIEARARIEVSATLTFSEPELRALDALAAYGDRAFLKVFYEHLGKSALQPHEAGLRSLFASIKEQMGSVLNRGDDARRVFNRERVAVFPETLERWRQAAERPAPVDQSARIEQMEGALRYALPLLQKYGHTQGDNADYHAELIAPIVNALGDDPATAQPKPDDTQA